MSSEPVSPHQAPPAHPARRRGRLLPKLVLASASLLVFLLLAEVVLSLAGFGNVEIYEPDPKLFWRLKPNQDCFTKVDNKPVHINSRGTRGPEFEVPKPKGTFRILSLGDSKTFGWGLTEAETYSARAETLLREKAPSGRNIEVINAGVNAWSYPQIKLYLQEHGLGFEPDIAVLADANLWTQFSEDSDPAFVQTMLSRVRLKNLLRRSAIYHWLIEVQLNRFYQQARTRFIPIDPKQDELFKEQQKSDPDAFFKKAIEEFCTLAKSKGVRPVVIFIPILYDLKAGTVTNVQKAKREICERLGVPFIDFTDDLKADADSFYLDADPVHLNVKGNEVVGRRLADLLAGVMAR
jgi:lysophospholipase L1-like esterase